MRALRAVQTFGISLTVAAAAGLALPASAAGTKGRFVTVDRFVPHVSTVDANEGQRVALFLHEKLDVSLANAIAEGRQPSGRVVLFVHGNSIPTVPDYDLPYKDYSWMAYLADAGFDTFSLDHTGYGHSPRPAMENPCNMSEENRALLSPDVAGEACRTTYAHPLTSYASDWDEIDAVVDYIRDLRGVERISLIGWSRGGPRAGGYAARNPDKVDKLILYAPAYEASAPAGPPEGFPPDGYPMELQTYDALMQDRWQSGVACDGQVDPGIRSAIWQSVMSFDPLGATWRPEGVMRVRVGTYFGWNETLAARIAAPTLILAGRQDGLLPAAEALYPDLTGTDNKVLVTMECATHFAVWEATQYKQMHEASLEWLSFGEFRGQRQGSLVLEAADN